MYSLVIIFLVFMIMKCGASTQNSAHLTIFKRSDFRGEFKQTSVAISAAQLKVEAAKTKAKKEKEGTEMHTKQPGLRLDKSERKGYLPPEHLSRKTPPGMKQLKNKGKAIEIPVKKKEKKKKPATLLFTDSGSSAPTIMQMSRTNAPKDEPHSHPSP